MESLDLLAGDLVEPLVAEHGFQAQPEDISVFPPGPLAGFHILGSIRV